MVLYCYYLIKTFYEKPCEEKLIYEKEYTNQMIIYIGYIKESPPWFLQIFDLSHTNPKNVFLEQGCW
jgi:hypothetical protein